jgi:hypothetical protein
MRVLRLWNQTDAGRAAPYLRSVLGSLREHWLEAQSKRRDRERLDRRPGRPDRRRMLTGEALDTDRKAAEEHFNDAVEELMRMDVYLVDPVQGVALIPFRKENDLAWYVFNAFDERGVSGWRYHSDPLEACRPLPGVKDQESGVEDQGSGARGQESAA